jgi:hypothetical protein
MDALSQMNVAEFSAALATDLAADLYERETIFQNYGLSPEMGAELVNQPWFKAMISQAKRDWDALDNVRDRIKAKAQIALEDSIPTVYGIIADRQTPGAARVAAFKELKEVSGMSARETGDGGPGYIPIQIFLDGREAPPTIVINPGSQPLTQGKRSVQDDYLEDEVEEGVIVDPSVVTKAVTHAALASESEPCFTLGMEE